MSKLLSPGLDRGQGVTAIHTGGPNMYIEENIGRQGGRKEVRWFRGTWASPTQGVAVCLPVGRDKGREVDT